MQAQGHVNMIPNYLFIQITTMMTWKFKRKLEFLSIYALKKKKKTWTWKRSQGNEKVQDTGRIAIIYMFFSF